MSATGSVTKQRPPGDGVVVAAANPAAPCPDCYYPHPDYRFIFGKPLEEIGPREKPRTVKHSYVLHERIRALEAELSRVGTSWIEAVNRAEKAEAELAECRDGYKLLEKAGIAINWRARAEKAEARVTELEEQLLDSRHWPHVVENISDPICIRCQAREKEGKA